MFTTLAVAVCRCLLSAASARPLAACLSSADAGATAAFCPPAEPLLPLVALYFFMADCYVVASALAPSSHCCSCHHCCHCFVIVTTHPHLWRNPLRRKKRQKKSIFIYGTTFKKNESGSDFQLIQIWNDCSQIKIKNTAGTHYCISLSCIVYHLVWATKLSLAAVGLVFPALVLGYYFFIVKSMTYQFLHRLKNLYDYCWQQ